MDDSDTTLLCFLSGARRDPGTVGQLTRLLDIWSQRWRDDGQFVWPGDEPGEVWVADTNFEGVWNPWQLWQINDVEAERFQKCGSIYEDPRDRILNDCGIRWWYGTWKWHQEDVSVWMRSNYEEAETPPLIISPNENGQDTRECAWAPMVEVSGAMSRCR